MKKLALLLVSLFIFSCSNSDDDIPLNVVQAERNISRADTLQFLISAGMPVEGGVGISVQANHYEVSEIRLTESGLLYLYRPTEGFTGSDYVEITEGHSDGAEVYAKTVTKLTIHVSE